LLAAGGYCLHAAWRKDRAYLPLAAIPLLFGVQQIGEGIVWLGVRQGNPAMTHAGAMLFLFFALAFWPVWLAFSACSIARRAPRRRLLAVLNVVSLFWAAVLYVPLATGGDDLLAVQVVHHSIQYDYDRLPIYEFIPRPFLRILYMVQVALPMLFIGRGGPRMFGWLLGGSALVSFVLFSYAFVSVWCFMAAILALYLCAVLHNLPDVLPRATTLDAPGVVT
jgi:hypothetical protein